jgi:hypothetical protein
MRKSIVALSVALALVIAMSATVALAVTPQESASGHGALRTTDPDGKSKLRQFTFNAQRQADGTVTGHAVLINPAFTGENGHSPYQLHVDISCLRIVGNIAIMGGTTRKTNDPSLVDAVFFSVQDNGEGKDAPRDRISRVFFWDDDPTTTGDPQACLLTGPADFPLEEIENGNIQVRPTGL